MSDFSEERVRSIAREEIRNWLEAGDSYLFGKEGKAEASTKVQYDDIPPVPEEFANDVTVTADAVTPKHYLARGWDAVNTWAKSVGYHWVSAGKNSRWER